MPEDGVCKLAHEDILPLEDILEIVKAAASLGIHKIRLTGGEPLVRKNVLWLCEEIKKIDGINELALTTNVLFLRQLQRT